MLKYCLGLANTYVIKIRIANVYIKKLLTNIYFFALLDPSSRIKLYLSRKIV